MTDNDMTFESLGRNDFVLYQQKDGFRFGTDSVLLAWFACSFLRKRHKNPDMLELGSGCGGASMCVAARNINAHIDCIEIMEKPYETLKKNIEVNNISDRVFAYNSDIRSLPREVKDKSYDVVFANPPYFTEDRGTKTNHQNSSVEKLKARFQENGDLDDFVRIASSRIKPSGGHVVMVMTGDRLNDLISSYNKYGLTPSKLLTVHSFEDRNACIILLAGKKGSKNSELKILPPLILNEKDSEGNIKNTASAVRIYEEEHKDCFI